MLRSGVLQVLRDRPAISKSGEHGRGNQGGFIGRAQPRSSLREQVLSALTHAFGGQLTGPLGPDFQPEHSNILVHQILPHAL
jgi:hypothetical protein